MDEQIEAAIDLLRQVQLRPEMYGSHDPWSMQTFLFGFACGLRILGLDVVGMFAPTAARRGWLDPHGPIFSMREKRMPDREIMTELIEIQIDALREFQKRSSPAR